MAPSKPRRSGTPTPHRLAKASSGIAGLDAVTSGGLPRGRCTLVCGGPGTGKTLLGIQFLIHGARDCGEPGVLVTFEESAKDIKENVASLGFDLKGLMAAGKIAIDHVVVERKEVEEAGEFDLEGLFIRIGYAVDKVGARRVVLDTVESLFSGLPNQLAVRSELRRLFGWLKARGLTTLITAEAGERSLTREGLEEYVSDCVLVLDQRMREDVATRRLRILKYRGSAHANNEMPFIIDERGFSVVPITESHLDRPAPRQRVSTGIPDLDRMLGGRGLYRGSVALVSGTAGTGKTTVAAHFAAAACQRGERAIFFTFEESPQTLVRDMQAVGLDLHKWVRKGLLRFVAARTTSRGLEGHLAVMHRALEEFKPAAVAIDPVSGFTSQGDAWQAKNMLVLLSDLMRGSGATAVMTNLTSGGAPLERTASGVSSMADAWILLRDAEFEGERHRLIHVLKARGIGHSNQVREFSITPKGIRIPPADLGDDGPVAGRPRAMQGAGGRAGGATAGAPVALLEGAVQRSARRLRRAVAALEADELDGQAFARQVPKVPRPQTHARHAPQRRKV